MFAYHKNCRMCSYTTLTKTGNCLWIAPHLRMNPIFMSSLLSPVFVVLFAIFCPLPLRAKLPSTLQWSASQQQQRSEWRWCWWATATGQTRPVQRRETGASTYKQLHFRNKHRKNKSEVAYNKQTWQLWPLPARWPTVNVTMTLSDGGVDLVDLVAQVFMLLSRFQSSASSSLCISHMWVKKRKNERRKTMMRNDVDKMIKNWGMMNETLSLVSLQDNSALLQRESYLIAVIIISVSYKNIVLIKLTSWDLRTWRPWKNKVWHRDHPAGL